MKANLLNSPERIDAYHSNPKEPIKKVWRGFVLSKDETDFSGSADTRIEKVIVPDTYLSEYISNPADGNVKKATRVGAIAADDKPLEPGMMLLRKTIEAELFLWSYKPDNVPLVHQENGFTSFSLFQLWISEILIPFITEKRARTVYFNMAVLILDDCFCHGGESFLSALQQEQILSVFLPRYTSDQTQPQDLSVFSPLKQFYSAPIRVSMIGTQTAQVRKMADEWQHATLPLIIVSAFRAAGLLPYQQVGKTFLWAGESQAKTLQYWEQLRTFKKKWVPTERSDRRWPE